MPFHPVSNCVQLLLQGQHVNSLVENTFYFKYQSGLPPTAAELSQLAADFVASTAAQWTQLYTGQTRFDQITVRDLATAGGLQVVYNILPNIVGGDAGGPNPGNSSLALRRRTALAGKSHRGRIELLPFPESTTQNDVVSPAQATKVAQLAARLLVPYARAAGGVFRPAVASFKEAASQAITTWAFDTILDSMKTRLTGHGA